MIKCGMQNLLNDVLKLLESDDGFFAENKMLKNVVTEAALKLDTALLELLQKNNQIKKHFFVQAAGVWFFDQDKFIKFINSKDFLPDSFTIFKNHIGLTDGDEYLKDSGKVVLAWPYKDCVLEGGQDKEDVKQSEIFYNETLAPDEIDRLFEPKVLTNLKKIDKDGEHKVEQINEQDNLIIKGNNLLALHSLKKKYRGKVKLIYIDPPYNTGSDGFNYNDSFNHSTWLTFMKNRLEVAKQLLSEEGSIYISIDNNELPYLQILMDEIFGNENKKNIITVKRSAVSGAKVINPGVVNVSEFIIVYSKDFKKWQANKVFRKKGRDERYNNYITNFESEPEKWKFSSVLDGWAESLGIEKTKLKKYFGDNYDEELEKFYLLNAHRIMQFVTLDENAVSDEVIKIKNKSKNDSSRVHRLKRENGKLDYFIFKGKAILFLVNRLMEIDGEKVFAEPLTDIWEDVLPNDLHNEGGVSLKKGKKPEKLIQRIIELSSKSGDLILDYHLGSGTTAAVAHKMGRRYICVEQLDYGNNDSVVRLQNTIKGEQSGISKAVNWKGGGSFVYAELKQWNEEYMQAIQEAKTAKEIAAIYKKMRAEAFFRYEVDLSRFEQKQFDQLTLDEQKKVLLLCLDKNHLYVNYSEMEDATYKILTEEKKINKQFYS